MYVKIFAGILDSSIAKSTPLRRFFQDLLLLADPDGNVIATKEAIANRLRVPLEEVEWGISELLKPDPDSYTPDFDGRRIEALEGMGYGWRIVNYGFYRGLRTTSDLRAANARRQQAYRDRHKSNGSNAPVALRNESNAISEAEAEAEAEAEKIRTANAVRVESSDSTGVECHHVPVQKIVDLYHVSCSSLPRVFKLTAARREQIKARWREDMTDLEDWKTFFERVAKSDFLMGRAKPSAGRTKIFRADIGWLTKAENFAKIMEGKYDG